MNKYQFKRPTPSGLGTAYYYCYGDDRFENYLNLKNMKYKKLEETDDSGRNLFNEKDKEIERLNNIIDKAIEYLEGTDLEKLINEEHSYACNLFEETMRRINDLESKGE